MNRATVAASGSTLAAIASAAAPDEERNSRCRKPRRRLRRIATEARGSVVFRARVVDSSRASLRLAASRRDIGAALRGARGADAPRAASPTKPRTPPAPLNPGDEARTGRRAALRATAVGGFGVRWTDPDATGANARASVTIAREEERSASPASGLRVRARRDVSERALVR